MGRKKRGEEAEETVCSIRMEAIGQMVLMLILSSLEDHAQNSQEEYSRSVLFTLPQSYFCCLFDH